MNLSEVAAEWATAEAAADCKVEVAEWATAEAAFAQVSVEISHDLRLLKTSSFATVIPRRVLLSF